MQFACHKFTTRSQANNVSTLIPKALIYYETDPDVDTHAVLFILWLCLHRTVINLELHMDICTDSKYHEKMIEFSLILDSILPQVAISVALPV